LAEPGFPLARERRLFANSSSFETSPNPPFPKREKEEPIIEAIRKALLSFEKGDREGFLGMHFQIAKLLHTFLPLKFAVCFVKSLNMVMIRKIHFLEENRQ
jgi:hypothetical protein